MDKVIDQERLRAAMDWLTQHDSPHVFTIVRTMARMAELGSELEKELPRLQKELEEAREALRVQAAKVGLFRA